MSESNHAPVFTHRRCARRSMVFRRVMVGAPREFIARAHNLIDRIASKCRGPHPRARRDVLSRGQSLRAVAVVPLAAVVSRQCEAVGNARRRRLARSAVVALAEVVCSQCEAVGGTRGPLDSIRRLGAMGRGHWRPMRRWVSANEAVVVSPVHGASFEARKRRV